MSVSLRKVAKFKLGQVVEVVAGGWGLAPALIGNRCTITAIACSYDKVTYKVSGLAGEAHQLSTDIWEQSFKEVPLTAGEQAALIVDKMDAINQAIAKLKEEHADLLTELLAVVETN